MTTEKYKIFLSTNVCSQSKKTSWAKCGLRCTGGEHQRPQCSFLECLVPVWGIKIRHRWETCLWEEGRRGSSVHCKRQKPSFPLLLLTLKILWTGADDFHFNPKIKARNNRSDWGLLWGFFLIAKMFPECTVWNRRSLHCWGLSGEKGRISLLQERMQDH